MNLKVVAAAALLASGLAGIAQAGTANMPGNGSVGTPYDMGVVGTTPTTLAVLISGLAPLTTFEEYANFTVGPNLGGSASGSTLWLNLGGTDVNTITGFTVEVWPNAHPFGGSTPVATFAGNNTTVALPVMAPGLYHLDMSGTATVGFGQYSVSLQVTPVPEPGTYALMIAGLGAVGFLARRRRIRT